jgi:predicted anti-sigma-YlaC factor YlaD
MVPKQNRAEFRALLEKGLAIDPDKHKDVRLANLVAQQRALRLMARTDDLILRETSLTTEEQE